MCKAGRHEVRAKARCPYCTTEDAPRRFWTYIHFFNGHGLFTGTINKRGYGMFHIGGRKYKRAHIYAYELKNGPVPEGFELGHTCEFTYCVIHVRPVTHLQNVREGKVGTPEVNAKISATKRRRIVEPDEVEPTEEGEENDQA